MGEKARTQFHNFFASHFCFSVQRHDSINCISPPITTLSFFISPPNNFCVQSETGLKEVEPSPGSEMALGPKFIQLGKNVTAGEGGAARLTCEVVGKVPVKVEWLKDGRDVMKGDRIRVRQL